MVRFNLPKRWLLATLALAYTSCVVAKSSSGDSVLVLLNEVGEEKQFSEFFGGLQERGFNLKYETPLAEITDLELIRFGERRYDHIIFFADQTLKFPEQLSAKTLIQFVNLGGNILVTTGPKISETVRNLGMQFGVYYEERDTFVIDHFQYDRALDKDGRHTVLAMTQPLATASLPTGLGRYFNFDASTPVLYQGIGHVISDNPMVSTVLSASDTAYSSDTQDTQVVDEEPIAVGHEIGLVSVFQARNNARVAFSGSRQFFSDAYFKAPVEFGLPGQLQSFKSSGNKALATRLTQWTLQEIGVLRVNKVLHHKSDEISSKTASAENYRIKDDVTYRIDISEYNEDHWEPFKTDDIQLEAIMLDPYIRTNLTAITNTKSKSKRTATTYETQFQLPDVFGVYTLQILYQRPGYSWIENRSVVPVRPFQHDEYPRFLTIAYPYYTGAASVMVGFFVFCAVWLYTAQDKPNTNNKNKNSHTSSTDNKSTAKSSSSSSSTTTTTQRKSK
ncbi:Dolichyl-diphosphooligosaccharide--protein glycosyltransferase subunit WBP1 [Syncephalis fuscata]|nr:Dolichyl-diphosphooligosaccharide--protein glycosyltransferase subunit WBP1 [Syncephalis fuscata]